MQTFFELSTNQQQEVKKEFQKEAQLKEWRKIYTKVKSNGKKFAQHNVSNALAGIRTRVPPEP